MSSTRGHHGRLLEQYLRPHWRLVLGLALVLLVSTGLQLVAPRILGGFIDAVQGSEPTRRLLSQAVAFMLAAIVEQAASLTVTYLSENVAWEATNALRADLASHCLRLDLSFHKAHSPGELIERIDGDVSTLAGFFSQMMINLLGNGLLAAGALVALFAVDWRIGLIGITYAGSVVLVPRALQQHTVRAWEASRQSEAGLYGYLGERLYGTEDIRGNGAETYVKDGLNTRMRAVTKTWIRARARQSLQTNVAALIFVIAEALAIGLAVGLYLGGRSTLGIVYLVAAYTALLKSPVGRIQKEIGDLHRAAASIERVEGLLATQTRLVDAPQRSLPQAPLSVAVQRVSFQYPDGPSEEHANAQPRVLDDVSFNLQPGQVLGLLGRTGSGKTTLARLIFRLYDPTEGAILLGGVQARDVALDELRRRVGLVTQDVSVFQASVRDNLALFDNNVADRDLLAALEGLGLAEWYASLPSGLDTLLKPGTEGMSAGQAQLLALARVFLGDPGILILDEASSRLDPITERLLDRAIGRLTADRTTLIIAHRLATVRRADQIVILDQGRVVEQGDRLRLEGDPSSRLSNLLRTGLEEVLV